LDANSIKFGVYGVGHKNGWLASGYIGGAEDLYSTSRHVTFSGIDRRADASPKGEEFSSRWGLACDHKMPWATLRPAVAVEYDRVMLHAFDESGAGALDSMSARRPMNRCGVNSEDGSRGTIKRATKFGFRT